jgi:hypothetical protein
MDAKKLEIFLLIIIGIAAFGYVLWLLDKLSLS